MATIIQRKLTSKSADAAAYLKVRYGGDIEKTTINGGEVFAVRGSKADGITALECIWFHLTQQPFEKPWGADTIERDGLIICDVWEA